MTNEEKAHEIAVRLMSEHLREQNGINQRKSIQKALFEMAEWKEKQMIAKTKTFLKEIARVCDITDANGYCVDESYLLAEFEKNAKGE